MYRNLEHPEITMCLRTGYPSWMQPDDEEFDQDAYEAYLDHCYEEMKERKLFGDD